MRLTWYGQSAFRVEVEGATILIDPFLSYNPLWGKGWEGPAEGVTHVLVTHGHNDHFGDTIAILEKTGAMLVANAEICDYAGTKGIENLNPGNHGGTVDCGGFTTTFVNALHSSSVTVEDGKAVYMGNPNGLVLHFPNDKTLYHMGDTDIFSDMALINELHQPQIGLVPVGDRFTMGGAVAALACRRFFSFEAVVPCHYKTFGLLDQAPDAFVDGMEGSGARVVVPEVGDIFEP
jgi:L-ascorbate metabolism protein UlaG (beta-lactamase superfamily)